MIAETACTFTIAHRAGRYARVAERVTQGVSCEWTLTNRSARAAAGFVVNEALAHVPGVIATDRLSPRARNTPNRLARRRAGDTREGGAGDTVVEAQCFCGSARDITVRRHGRHAFAVGAITLGHARRDQCPLWSALRTRRSELCQKRKSARSWVGQGVCADIKSSGSRHQP